MFKKKKKFFNYENKIILTNGASIKILSINSVTQIIVDANNFA
jgi:hypothetical protein